MLTYTIMNHLPTAGGETEAARGVGWDPLWSYVVAMVNKEIQQTQPEKATWPEALNLHLSPGGQQRVQLRL